MSANLFNTGITENYSSSGKYADNLSSIKIKYLEHKIDKLYMITEALWLIIKEKNHIDDENLTELIAAIDLKDGKRDGKVATSGPRNCTKCGRVNSIRQMYCIYCGTFLNTETFK